MGATAVVAAVSALLIGLQIAAVHRGFQGPLHSLISDYVATPKSATLPWAGLGLALVGLTNRHRLVALGLAAGVDAVFAAERVLRGGALTIGNGPLIVLTGLAVLAGLRWSGTERRAALGAAGWGMLLIVASKAADTWLRITAISRPRVLDEYAMLADHAFAQPSWLVGRVIDAAGPIPYAVLHWVYIELPVAAMVVAVYQLRNVTVDGWPRHHLMRTFMVLGLIGPLIYLVFPVVGPIYAFGADGHGWQIANYWPHILPPAGFAPHALPFDDVTPRNCMPSMHVGWALLVFIHSRRGPRQLRWGGAVWLAATVAATLGFGYHYGVDLVAGAVLCLTVEAAVRDPQRGWGARRIGLVAGGATFLAILLLCYRYLAAAMAQLPLLFGPVILGALAVFVAAFFAWPAGVKLASLSTPQLKPAAGAAPRISGGAAPPVPAHDRWAPSPSARRGQSRHG
ncbi:DUF5933 domain-containing protein [Mycobacterium sp. pUA109]